MAERTALHLLVAVGEHPCNWWLPDLQGDDVVELPGTLTLAHERPPVASIHGDAPTELEQTEDGSYLGVWPQPPREFPVLRGQLFSGQPVMLLDAIVETWLPGHTVVNARAALVGGTTEMPDDGRCTHLRLQITGLDVINARAPLKKFTFPPSDTADQTWSVTVNPKSTHAWADADAGTELTLGYARRAEIGDPYAYRMAFSPQVVINGPAADLDQWLTDWIDPLKRIVSLVTGEPERVTYLALGASHDTEVTWAEVFGSGITQAPYESSRAQLQLQRQDPALRFGEDSHSLLDVVRNWRGLAASHNPLIETYGSLLGGQPLPARTRLQLFIQGLEGLHGHEHEEEQEERTLAHTERREEVLAAARAHLDAPMNKFLKKNLGRRPFSSLDTVLRETIAPLPLDLADKFAATALVGQLLAEKPDLHDWAGALREARNGLAHGRRSFETAVLVDVVALLDRVARAHCLRLLGCSDEVLIKVLSR